MQLLSFKDPVKDDDVALSRARAGMAYLDKKLGADWDRKIDLDRLDIGSPRYCVLSQLICRGHWSLLFPANPVDFGFSCGELLDALFWLPMPHVKRSYRRLTAAWRLLFLKRQGERELQVAKSRTSEVERAQPSTVSQAV